MTWQAVISVIMYFHPLLVVVVSFDRPMTTVNESIGAVEVCVICSELPQREIMVDLEQELGTAAGTNATHIRASTILQ